MNHAPVGKAMRKLSLPGFCHVDCAGRRVFYYRENEGKMRAEMPWTNRKISLIVIILSCG